MSAPVDVLVAPLLAYHFVGESLRDGRAIPADGEWLVHDGAVKLYASGLHASIAPFDALQYAPGNTLCLVELRGTIVRGDDKVVASERRIIKRIDAEPLLREFARWSALQVIELWDAPDVVRQYLTTGDESLRAAAWAAARDAAWGRPAHPLQRDGSRRIRHQPGLHGRPHQARAFRGAGDAGVVGWRVSMRDAGASERSRPPCRPAC